MVEQQHRVLQHGQLRQNKGWKAERRTAGAGSGTDERCMALRRCQQHRPVLQHRQLGCGKSMGELACSRDGLLPTLPRGGSRGTGQRRAAQHGTSQCSTTRHSAAQRSTAQHSAAQHSMTQRSTPGSWWPSPRPCCPAAAQSAWPAAVSTQHRIAAFSEDDTTPRNNSCGGGQSGCSNPAARAAAATTQQRTPPTCPVQTQILTCRAPVSTRPNER